MLKELRTNERIRVREVRLIGVGGENAGVVPVPEALSLARGASLDLVEVDPNGDPPVCRILDYGKWKYQQAKKGRDAHKHQRSTMIHEVRVRPRIGQHDMAMKVRIAERLLAGGNKVRFSVMFRGREMSHPEIGRQVLGRALEGLNDVAIAERPPAIEGRFLSVILTPTTKKPASATAEGEKEEMPVGEVQD